MKIKVVENSIFARIARVVLNTSSVAVTFGTYIHLSGVKKQDFLNDSRWVNHELEHVRQYKRIGFVRFLYLYLIESMKVGYYNNRFEVEARNAETGNNNITEA